MIRPILLIGSIGLLLATPLHAEIYNWSSPTAGGIWSSDLNWLPTGVPVALDTANLTDATADRTVIYDAAANGTIGTLNFTQTSAFKNSLEVQRALTITSALTLGSSAGTVELNLKPTGIGTLTAVASGGLTIASGGRLVLGLGTENGATTRINTNITMTGGEIVVTDSLSPGGAAQRTIGGTLTTTGGSIAVGASQVTGTRESRLSITGNFSTANTAISGSGDAQLILEGATNTVGAGTTFGNPGTGAKTVTTVLSGSRDQSLTSQVALGNLFFRQFADGTLIKTVSVADQSGPNIGSLQFAGRNNQTIGLKLGSDLTTAAGTGNPFMSGVTQAGNIRFSIDSNSFTLNLGNTTTNWTPTIAGTATAVTWALINSGTAGVGGIKARGYTFTGANTSVDIGPGMVLEATGGNTIANNLGSAGTIDPTSIFRYGGNAAAATPATLVSGRALGQLEIGNGTAAGALKLAGDLTATGSVTVKNLGSFDLGTQTLTAPAGVAVAAGGILRGGSATTAGSILGNLTAAGVLAPGSTPVAGGPTIGTLSVAGSLGMTSGSALSLELVSASSFDKAIAASISLTGTVGLNLTLDGAYVHNEGTTFLLLENLGVGSIAGFFTSPGSEGLLLEGETFLVGGNPFQITYAGGLGANDVVIAAVPEPSSMVALIGGIGMLLSLGRVRKRK